MTKLFSRFGAFLGMGVLLAGCAYAVTSAQIFEPDETVRRAGGSELAINREDELPASTTLTHQRIDAPFGKLAVTVAETASDTVILRCGGNITDRRTDGVTYILPADDHGDVILFDYPGYGDSDGEATADDLMATVETMAAFARAKPHTRLVAWGHSLGGFVCAQIVKQAPEAFDGMIFEASAVNMDRAAQARVPLFAKPVVRTKVDESIDFDNVAALEGYFGTVLVIGAGADRILPPELSRDLADGLIAQGQDAYYEELDGATHSGVHEHPRHADVIARFFQLLDEKE